MDNSSVDNKDYNMEIHNEFNNRGLNMDEKICPVCEGNKVIQESDSRGFRQYTCRTCKGKGAIPDKIRKEFEKHMQYVDPRIWWVEELERYSVKVASESPQIEDLWNNKYQLFKAGYKSRDEEIKETLQIIYESIMAKDEIAAIELLSEMLEDGE